MKKFVLVLVAVIMVMSLSVVALAASPKPEKKTDDVPKTGESNAVPYVVCVMAASAATMAAVYKKEHA